MIIVDLGIGSGTENRFLNDERGPRGEGFGGLMGGDRSRWILWPNSIQAVGRKEFPAAWCSVVPDRCVSGHTQKRKER